MRAKWPARHRLFLSVITTKHLGTYIDALMFLCVCMRACFWVRAQI